jgi:hypothetical protein
VATVLILSRRRLHLLGLEEEGQKQQTLVPLPMRATPRTSLVVLEL